MNRVDVVLEAISALNPSLKDWSRMYKSRVDSNIISQLMECIRFIIWPTVVQSPVVPSYVDVQHRFEWIIRQTFDLLIAQIESAFFMHGDRTLVSSSKAEFAPVPPFDANSIVSSSPHEMENERAFRLACRSRAQLLTEEFMVHRLIEIRKLLNMDVEIAFQKDAAATSAGEIIHSYPGPRCMVFQRVAHALYLLGVPNGLTRALTEHAHSITGIDIHPHTHIGHHFFIDHGTGIVIGATSIIGNYVSIYQGVTLGAKSFPAEPRSGRVIKHQPRHPIIEDHVTIYANAVVLGRVTIGRGSTIGGNCWVVNSLPPQSVVAQKSNKVLQTQQSMFELQDGGSGI